MTITVKKSHHIITSRMNLSAREQDFLSLTIKTLKSQSDAYKFQHGQDFTMETVPTIFTFTTVELTNLFKVSRSAVYHALDDVTDKLLNKVFHVRNDKTQEFEKAVLFSNTKYSNGILTLEVSKSTAMIMLDYSKGFGEVDLKLSLALNGGYEKRLLDLLSRFKNKRDFKATIDEYAKMVGTSRDSHKTFSDFRKVAIERPIAKLVKVSNGAWTVKDGCKKGYELIKDGRSYSHIIFRMNFNEFTKKTETNKSDTETEVTDLYNAVLNGEQIDKDVLTNLLSKLEDYPELPKTKEFIMMWSSCMSTTKS